MSEDTGANSAPGQSSDPIGAAANMARDAGGKLIEGAQKARETLNEHVIEPAKRAGEAIRASGAKAVEGGTTISMKLIDQAEANARQAFSALREAAAAKDMADVMRIQGDFLRETSERSMAHAREVGDMIAQFGREAVTPLRGKSEE